MIMGLIIPYIYTLLVAGAFGVFFKKKIEEALAPAFFVQILLMLISGMAFGSVSVGIVLMMVLSVVGFVIACIKDRGIKPVADEYFSIGTGLITLFYLLIYVTNYGCTFSGWDEYMHWGIFDKEMFRTDALYCTSTAPMMHKDYVPAISLFETLWCRLSFRYTEANTYRGIQMLQAAMLLPLISSAQGDKADNPGKFKVFLRYISRIVIIFGPPLFYFGFYHTIVKDLILGVLVFYCMYVIISQKESMYKTFILVLSATVLVLTKMTGVIFLPMIVCFYFVWTLMFEKKRCFISSLIMVVIPVASVVAYSKYVDLFVTKKSDVQSFSAVRLKDIVDILSHNGAISYQSDVESAYFKALFETGVIRQVPIVLIVVIAVAAIFLLARSQKDKDIRNRILLIDLWVFLGSIAYIAAMLYLYLTAFHEGEARSLASYSRYMQTWVVIIVALIGSMITLFRNQSVKLAETIMAVVVAENVLMFIGLNELIPGALLGEKHEYISEATAIEEACGLDGKVLLISYGDEGSLEVQYIMRYQCSPRNLTWISPRTAFTEADADITDPVRYEASEFAREVALYDLVYIWNVDDRFYDDYSSSFINPEIISDHRLYYVACEGDTIRLRDVSE